MENLDLNLKTNPNDTNLGSNDAERVREDETFLGWREAYKGLRPPWWEEVVGWDIEASAAASPKRNCCELR